MEKGLEGAGRVALITGAGGGIGSETAMAFAMRGYSVICADIKLDSAARTVAQLREAGCEALAAHADIADVQSVARLFSLIEHDYGRLDAAFNNAGVGVPPVELADCLDEDWLHSINVNLTGTWYCLKAEIRMMLTQQGGGRIVNNGSVYAQRGGPNAPYTASKHGIAGLTKSAAMTYAARDIRVNAVCPGLIDSGMGASLIQHFQKRDAVAPLISKTPVARAGIAAEVAAAVIWLCSDDARYVHGHMLAVDGGLAAV